MNPAIVLQRFSSVKERPRLIRYRNLNIIFFLLLFCKSLQHASWSCFAFLDTFLLVQTRKKHSE